MTKMKSLHRGSLANPCRDMTGFALQTDFCTILNLTTISTIPKFQDLRGQLKIEAKNKLFLHSIEIAMQWKSLSYLGYLLLVPRDGNPRHF